ncbi:hypothetical protein Pint_07623 [Pistacia integerrima]|uniref:Uncharacterized protein n=1 Tax=Pistacia integerrima TaxID=434235 RepID=A0ACC0XZS8_9ROSI|nr:hypothetical protein Pint_07623 [Pistacia integerrima]
MSFEWKSVALLWQLMWKVIPQKFVANKQNFSHNYEGAAKSKSRDYQSICRKFKQWKSRPHCTSLCYHKVPPLSPPPCFATDYITADLNNLSLISDFENSEESLLVLVNPLTLNA